MANGNPCLSATNLQVIAPESDCRCSLEVNCVFDDENACTALFYCSSFHIPIIECEIVIN